MSDFYKLTSTIFWLLAYWTSALHAQNQVFPLPYLNFEGQEGVVWIAELIDEDLKALPTYTGSDHVNPQDGSWPNIAFDSTSWYTLYDSSPLNQRVYERIYLEKRSLDSGELIWRRTFSYEIVGKIFLPQKMELLEDRLRLLVGESHQSCSSNYDTFIADREKAHLRWMEFDLESGETILDRTIDITDYDLCNYRSSGSNGFWIVENELIVQEAMPLNDSIYKYRFDFDGNLNSKESYPIYTNKLIGEKLVLNDLHGIEYMGIDTIYMSYPHIRQDTLEFLMQRYVNGALDLDEVIHKGLVEDYIIQCWVLKYGHAPSKIVYRVEDRENQYLATADQQGVSDILIQLDDNHSLHTYVKYGDTDLLFSHRTDDTGRSLAMIKGNGQLPAEVVHKWKNEKGYVTVVHDAQVAPDGSLFLNIRYFPSNTFNYQYAWVRFSADFIQSKL